MKGKKNSSDKFADMRRRAEEVLQRHPEELRDMQPEEIHHLIHELEVHQVELELQNEELRRTQLELEASHEKYFDLYDFAPVGYLTVSGTGFILEANLTAAAMLGLERGRVIKQPLSRFIAGDDQDIYYLHRKHLFETLEPQTCEMRMVRKDGSLFWARIETAAAKGEEGQALFRAAMSDITMRKRIEDHLRHSQKLEALGMFAGGIAHDFNNILAGIIGYASLLKNALPATSPYFSDLETIEQLSNRGAELTKSILAFARRGPYLPEPLNINRIVEDVLKVVGRTMGKTIDIIAKLSPCISNVLGDEGQISQVMMNLCVNACEAMPKGGTITVETKDARLGGEFFRIHPALKQQAYVSVVVSDTGIGMESGMLEHIYEPFFTSKDQKTKTGLGLAMVSGIIDKHGGCVEVESEPGKGSTFTVYLPATEEKERAVHAKPIRSLAGDETVLVIDDEDEFRESLGRRLENFGYTVVKASGGEEALKVLTERTEGVDLVLLDMIMKGMDGAEAFRRMRQIVPDLKVVICSGFSLDSRCQLVLKGGAKGFIQKPFEDKELALKLREVIEGH